MFLAFSPKSLAGFLNVFFIYRCCCVEKTVVATFVRRKILRNHEFSSRFVPFAEKKTVTTISFPFDTSESFVHEFFMMRALQQAECAANLDSEVPIGAVVVRNQTEMYRQARHPQQIYEILAEQHNRVEQRFDASAHAELLALRDAAATIENWRLINTTLYSTLEPCPMCLSAAQAFRVQNVAYGAPDLRLGACGTFFDLLSVARHPYHNISKVTSGIYGEECAQILRSFFRRRRKQPLLKDSTSFDTSLARQRRGRRWQFWTWLRYKISFRNRKGN